MSSTYVWMESWSYPTNGMPTSLHSMRTLERLAAVDPRKARVVEMRFFGGLSVQESAEALNVSEVTVRRDWQFAKVWLRRELSGEKGDGT